MQELLLQHEVFLLRMPACDMQASTTSHSRKTSGVYALKYPHLAESISAERNRHGPLVRTNVSNDTLQKDTKAACALLKIIHLLQAWLPHAISDVLVTCTHMYTATHIRQVCACGNVSFQVGSHMPVTRVNVMKDTMSI